MVITKLPTSLTLSIMNKYVVNNTTKLIQRKKIKCFLCNEQYRKIFNLKNEKKYNHHLFDNNNQRNFTSSSKLFTSPTTSIPSSITTTTTSMTPTTISSPSPPTTTTTTAMDIKQIETDFKRFQQLVEDKKDELKDMKTFPEL